MNLSRILPGARTATGAVHTEAPDGEGRVQAPQAAAATASAERSDRFEVSDAARARQAEAAAHHAEVDAAREALHAQDGLSAERLAQLQQRVEGGFYDAPHVVDAVADRAAHDLDPSA